MEKEIIEQEMDQVSIKTDTNETPVVNDVTEEGHESKPRIILTLRTDDNSPDAYFSSSNIQNNNVDKNQLPCTNKRKNHKIADNLVLNCVKRTPRRVSKDYSRESVLQNAIALKEKSYNLPGNETFRKNKSPKTNIKKCSIKTACNNETETESPIVSEINHLSWLGNNLFNGINNSLLDNIKTIKPVKRKRYYKGLTYSFKRSIKKRKKPNKLCNGQVFITSSEQDTDSQGTIITTYEDESSQGIYLSDQDAQNNSNYSSLEYENEAHSPDTGDAPQPESSSKIIQDRLCLCNSNEYIYVKTDSLKGKEQYCQAIDTISDKHVGCCNVISKTEIRLKRPSTTIPFLMFCDVHYHRMLIHHCCPVCGLFCTQGRFMMCQFHHLYHKDCEVKSDLTCPHCTIPSASKEINISLGQHKNPVFLPSRKLFKLSTSAKMSYRGSKLITNNANPDYNKVNDTSTQTFVLPSGKEITCNGLLGPTEVDELERRLFSILPECSGNNGHRYTYRSMYHAAKTGDLEKLIGCIATGLNPNHLYREWTMGSALHAAATAGFVIAVHILAQAGCQLDVLDRELNTPLMLAVLNNHNDVVKYLVKAGAIVDFKGTDGMTALHLAAKSGNLEACYYLLPNTRWSHHFVNNADDGGWTALVWAAEHNRLDIVLFLLSRKADPKIRDVEQNVALHWSAFSGSVEIIEALLRYNSDVNSINSHGDTPLHICARKDAYSCVVLLLARGARTDIQNNAGLLPIDSCVMENCNSYNAIKLSSQLRTMISLNCTEPTLRILNNDITKGYEKNPIQCVNGVDDEGEPNDFTYITENCFTSNISVDRTITSLQCCTCEDGCNTTSCNCCKISIRCWYAQDAKLSIDFNYADPPMLFECNQLCKCNKLKCSNRVVQSGITGRFQLFRTNDKGWGVITLKTILRGTYVCEYIGEIISDIEADTRTDDSYLFDLDNRDGETYCIDACRYGNIARFINHNCEPNLLPVRVFINHHDLHFPRIAFFANRDISANEELGFDYGEKFWQVKYKTFTCSCGSDTCKYSTTTIENTLQAYHLKTMAEHD